MPVHDVIVVGGGLAGLACAYRLHKHGQDVVVLEREARAGGHLRTEQRTGWRHERGPHTFLGSASTLRALALELGLEPVPAHAAANRRYIWHDGELREVALGDLLKSLIPPELYWKLLTEPVHGKPPREDESVREFFEPRIGHAATERFVQALVSGMYAGDIDELGIAGALPKIYALAKEGSLLRGALRSMRKPKGPKNPRGTFTFKGGLGALTGALAKALGDRVVTGVDATVEQRDGLWHVAGRSARRLVLATPANDAAKLLAPVSTPIATALAEIDAPPLALVHLLYKKNTLPRPPDGFGFLVPRHEGLQILGALWPSAMFDVCDTEHCTITVFVGGAMDRAALTHTDEEITAIAQGDLGKSMRITSEPEDVAVVRHAHAVPQYGRGHVAWRARVESLLTSVPGLSLAGNYLDGISMNDTVARSEVVAGAILGKASEAHAA